MRKHICDHAVDVLRETDNPAVGFGDSGLLHEIAEAAGWPHEGPDTERRVLNALDKTRGELKKRYFKHRGRFHRCFWLPEEAGTWP